jgi:hypothetical protein
MTQFDGKAWMTAPFGSSQNGGYWTPTGGFVADANMPKGDVLVAYKFRLFVAGGQRLDQQRHPALPLRSARHDAVLAEHQLGRTPPTSARATARTSSRWSPTSTPC